MLPVQLQHNEPHAAGDRTERLQSRTRSQQTGILWDCLVLLIFNLGSCEAVVTNRFHAQKKKKKHPTVWMQ
jgi:hypothetical protein